MAPLRAEPNQRIGIIRTPTASATLSQLRSAVAAGRPKAAASARQAHRFSQTA
jgi:hypothetical protein